MTSPRRRPDRPIESVALKVVFSASKETTAKVREAVPTARFRQGSCEVKLEGQSPGEVAEKAKAVLEKIRKAA
jgi:hypothetical protein